MVRAREGKRERIVGEKRGSREKGRMGARRGKAVPSPTSSTHGPTTVHHASSLDAQSRKSPRRGVVFPCGGTGYFHQRAWHGTRTGAPAHPLADDRGPPDGTPQVSEIRPGGRSYRRKSQAGSNVLRGAGLDLTDEICRWLDPMAENTSREPIGRPRGPNR